MLGVRGMNPETKWSAFWRSSLVILVGGAIAAGLVCIVWAAASCAYRWMTMKGG